jgi:CBS domain-containing protein
MERNYPAAMNPAISSVISAENAIPTIDGAGTVSSAISAFHQTKSSSLLVKGNEGELCGLLSEHDVVDAIARLGASALSQPISNFMSVDLIVCTPDETVHDALRLMSKNKIRQMPVVTPNGHLMGLVSVLELLSAFGETNE